MVTQICAQSSRSLDSLAATCQSYFLIERELEKINTFYLQKEAELKLRLETLSSKRRAAPIHGVLDDANGKSHVEWSAVEDGFRLLERDLGKLQVRGPILVPSMLTLSTAIRRDKRHRLPEDSEFDKRSTSTTKELYLARQVDVQPVFNRQLISELSDTVAACLLDLTDLSSGLQFEGPGANGIFSQQLMVKRTSQGGPYHDLEKNLRKAVTAADRAAITDCVRYSDVLAQDSTNVTRILWNVIIKAPSELADLILGGMYNDLNNILSFYPGPGSTFIDHL